MTWISLHKIMIHLVLLVVTAGFPSLGESTVDPPYRAKQTPCESNRECDMSKNEVCWTLYEGCYHGVCMCNPDTHVLDEATGICKYFRYGNELCSDTDICLYSMVCLNGTCRCPRGEMTEEGNFCLMSRHRMLGQTCNPTSDVCLQKSDKGYTTDDVRCSRTGQCICHNGYRRDGKSCRKPEGARCQMMYECQGGFMCLDGKCRCPHNYREVASKTKCADINAIVDLPVGAHCDEIDKATKYCATGLICHRCYNEHQEKCVRYSLSPSPNTAYASDSRSTAEHRSLTWMAVTWLCHVINMWR